MEHIPALNEHLIRELDRRQLGIRNKLLKRYDLNEKELSSRQPNYKIPDNIMYARQHNTITNKEEQGLYKTMYDCIQRSNLDLTPKQRKQLFRFCKDQIKNI